MEVVDVMVSLAEFKKCFQIYFECCYLSDLIAKVFIEILSC